MADIRQTGFLDNFAIRADEDPLSYGGRWQILSFSYGTHLRLQGGTVEVHAVTGGTAQTAAWVQNAYRGDVECWGHTGSAPDLREGLRLYLHMQPETIYYNSGGSEISGYRVRFNQNLGTPSTTISRYDAGTETVIGGPITHGFNAGLVLFRKIGTSLELWETTDSSGRTGWTNYLSATDSTYNAGFVGLGTEQDDPSPAWDSFGGGSRNRSQIYRYPSN